MLTFTEPAAPTFLDTVRASGKVSAGRLRIHNLVAKRVSASLELERGKLKISQLRADVLGGKHRGDWRADFTAASPVYTGAGSLTGISLAQLAEAMHDPWISGTAGGTYQITASGADSAAFWKSAEGEIQFDLRDGVLSRVSLGSDDGPLRVTRWEGRARLRSGKIEVEEGTLVSPAGAFEISGTASVGQLLDFKLIGGTQAKRVHSLSYSVTGTVAEPRVTLTTTSAKQEPLKP